MKRYKIILFVFIFLITIASASAWQDQALFNKQFAYLNITEGPANSTTVSSYHNNASHHMKAKGNTNIVNGNFTGDYGIYSDSTDAADSYWAMPRSALNTRPLSTVCLWMNISDTSGDILGFGDTLGGNDMWWRITGTSTFDVRAAGTWGSLAAGAMRITFTPNATQFSCLTNNASHSVFYLNGALVKSNTNKWTAATAEPFYFGAINNSGPMENEAQVSAYQIMFFNYNLTTAEILSLYQNTGIAYLENGSAPPVVTDATINLSDSFPANGTYWNVANLNINVTMNASNSTNATLWINGTINQTTTNIAAGNNIIIGFNVSFGANFEQNVTFEINITDGTTNATGTGLKYFVVDRLGPRLSTSLDSNTTYWTNQIDLLGNITDNLLVNYTLVDTCNNSLNNLTAIISPHELNESLNITNCSIGGTHHVNISACDNLQCTANSYNFNSMGRLELKAVSLLTGALITSFNITSNISSRIGTTNNTVYLDNLSVGTVNAVFNASASYEIVKVNLSVTSTYQAYNFSVYTVNSINFTVFEEITRVLINDTNLSIQLISSVYAANESTSNGTLYLDLLIPAEYTIRYSGENYTRRFRYLDLLNNTHNEMDLYLLSNDTGTSTTLHVYDDINNDVEGAYITAQRYYIDTNEFISVASCLTEITGECDIDLELNDEWYKFIIESPLGTVREISNNTIPKGDTLNFGIDLDESVLNNFYFMEQDLFTSLTFNNNTNTFVLTWNDPTNRLTRVCLEAYHIQYDKSVLFNSSCSTHTGGTLLVSVANISGRTYRGDAKVSFNPQGILAASVKHTYEIVNIAGTFGLYLVGISMVVFGLIGIFNIGISLILLPMPLFFASAVNIIDMSWMISGVFMIIGLIVGTFIIIRSR